MSNEATTETTTLVGEFIEVPAWQTFGMVVAERPTTIGPEGTVSVLVQESPDEPERFWRWYRLAPGEYEVV